MVSALIILFFAYLNIKGIKESGRVQFVIVLALILCVFLVFFGMLFTADMEVFKENYVYHNNFDLKQILQVVAITPFLFIGFDAIPQLVKDMNLTRSKASLMAVGALLIGMSCYILLNFTAGLAYGPSEAKALDWALGSAVLENLGKFGFLLLVIALASAVSGGINGFMICSTKLISAMSRVNILPHQFADVSKRGTLVKGIVFVSLISFFSCFLGREVVIWIVDMCSFGAAVTYFYVCINALMHTDSKRQKVESLLGAIFSFSFMLLLLLPFSPARLSNPALMLLFAWIAVGAVLFVRLFIVDRKKLNSKGGKK